MPRRKENNYVDGSESSKEIESLINTETTINVRLETTLLFSVSIDE